ncbi:hypothetical protein Trydic_g23454 [Trypoxylus dichotomus]
MQYPHSIRLLVSSNAGRVSCKKWVWQKHPDEGEGDGAVERSRLNLDSNVSAIGGAKLQPTGDLCGVEGYSFVFGDGTAKGRGRQGMWGRAILFSPRFSISGDESLN